MTQFIKLCVLSNQPIIAPELFCPISFFIMYPIGQDNF